MFYHTQLVRVILRWGKVLFVVFVVINVCVFCDLTEDGEGVANSD